MFVSRVKAQDVHVCTIMNHYLVGTKKVMGANHEVNSPKISHNFPR